MKKYADLHCHPHSRAFHWMRHTNHETKHKIRFHAWNVVLSNFKKQEKGKRAFSYSQCDPVKLWNSDTKLVFASLYPFEKGFFQGGEIDQNKLIRILDVLGTTGVGLLNPVKWVQALAMFITGGPTLLKSIRAFLQSLLMRMPIRRIKFFVSPEYDYYKELIRERDFLMKMSGVSTRNRIYIPGIRNLYKNVKKLRRKYPESLDANGVYTVCKNFDEVQKTIDTGGIAMVTTIEGMHALGTDTHLDEISNRIEEIKKWPSPVFFITFAHHFNNYLNGHAHSLPDITKVLSDQKEGMNADVNSIGSKVIKQLLSLDNDLNKDSTLGHRILLDLKHTSALSRKWYYEQVIEPCLAKGDTIPVILSHVGYSGWNTLQEAIEYAPNENDRDLKDGFYPWNINACGEDVLLVAKTSGLIGLCFDQRILGDQNDKTKSIDLLFRNLKSMVDVILASNELSQGEKDACWTYFSIGTDFEGYIDPTQDYSNALEFEDFEADLEKKLFDLSNQEGSKYKLNSAEDVATAVKGICFSNAYNFLQKNFQS